MKSKMFVVAGLSATLVLLLSALPATAGTVTMQFNGLPTGNNYAGEASYPYEVSVNGGPNQWMMCIGFNEHITGGETWKATPVSIGSLDVNADHVYYEAAFLFKQAVADGGANVNLQAADWWLLEGTPALTAGGQALVALAQSQTYTQGEYSDVLLYKAIPGTESLNLGTPQSFLSSTPEPGTLVMFGSGIAGLAGLLRRKLSV